MKKALFLLLLFASQKVISQKCDLFYSLEAGKGVVFQSFNQKGRAIGTIVYIVDSVTITSDTLTTAFITSTAADNKNNELTKMEYQYKCSGNNFLIDPVSMINPELFEPFKEMEFEIERDDIVIPSGISVNKKLKNAGCVIQVFEENQKRAEMNLKCFNRRVLSTDSISTPIGLFACFKISCETKLVVSEVMLPYTIEIDIVEYYSKGVGLVKTEMFDKKKKLLGYSVVSKVL